MTTNTLEIIAEEMAVVFYPVRHLDSATQVTTFFRDLGYELPGNQLFGELPVLVQLANELIAAVTALAGASTDEARLQALAKLLEALTKIVAEITSSINAIKSSVNAIPGFIANSDIDDLPVRLVDYLLGFYLWRSRRHVYGVMLFIGVLDEIDMPADAAKFQPAFKLRKIWWDRLPKFISAPQELPEIVYQWESGFKSDLFISRMYLLFNSFCLPGGLYTQSASVKSAVQNTTDGLQELRMPIFEKAVWPSTQSQFGVNISPVEQNGLNKPGFAIIPYIYGDTNFDFNVSEKLEIIFKASASVDAGVGLIFRPDLGIRFLDKLFSAPADSINVGLSLQIKQKEGTGEIILVGNPEASRLAIEGPHGKVFVSKGSDIDAGFEFGLDVLRLVVKGSDGDGFLNTVLGDGGITAEAGFGFGVSKKGGAYFTGSGGLEIQLPVHIELGPLEIQGLLIALKIRNGDIVLESGANIKLEVGPLVGLVENMGIAATLSFPSNGGNLGPVDLEVGFKPPKGVGLTINTGVVKGGGYLNFNFDKEEYSGSFELTIKNIISLSAIGLITTRMPDGSPGFSLLIIITAEFTPIQLGFGFTLSGVGGLLGLNRTMLLQPLAEGVRTGAINSVMFPTNVVANAPRIISDLQSFFPVHEGIFLIGPMAKLGWGTPNLVTLSLCIIIEIPGNIAILGVLKVVLPDEKAAVLILQANFIGAIEFDKKRVWFFASIFESRILFITIEGDMGVLVAWGDDANFVISVGGFHPAFTAPPLPFPELRRIAISILNNKYARIRVESYFAVTSNTVQFGANVELFFDMKAFKADGNLTFDALFQFSPFYFIITISASLSVQALGIPFFGVYFQGSLEGPTPWRIAGTGTVFIAGFPFPIPFSHTWGEEVETTLPPIKIVPLLVAEFEKLENWKAELPASKRIFVSLRKIEDTNDLSETSEKLQALPSGVVFPDDLKDKIRYDAAQQLLIIKGVMSREEKNALLRLSTDVLYEKAIEALFQKSQFIVLHPVGTLKISQRAIPLELQLDKVGNQKPEDADYFTVTVSTPGFVKKGDLDESFAMGQFKDMDDANKLSSPAFEKWKAGIELSAGDVQTKTSLAVKRVVRYEKIIIDTNYKRAVKPLFVLFANLFTLFLGGNAVSKSTLSQQNLIQKQPFADKVAIQPDLWVVASNADNSALAGTVGTFTSQAKAHEYMQQQVKERPDLAENVHVIPKTEVRRAAA